jgi:hypothetical protein
MFMIGGMGSETIKDIVQAKIMSDYVKWEKTPYTSQEGVVGR